MEGKVDASWNKHTEGKSMHIPMILSRNGKSFADFEDCHTVAHAQTIACDEKLKLFIDCSITEGSSAVAGFDGIAGCNQVAGGTGRCKDMRLLFKALSRFRWMVASCKGERADALAAAALAASKQR